MRTDLRNINEELLNEKDKRTFQQMTGGLLYLAICTRGDLLPAVHELTRKMSNPRQHDLSAAKKVIAYLSGTLEKGVTFYGDDVQEIFGYADSAFNSGTGDKKNKYGFCFQYGKRSAMFLNVCKRSTLIAQSSTEAEFYALAEACRELLWINSFLYEVKEEVQCKVIYQDNTSIFSMIEQDGVSDRNKHIDVKSNFVKKLQQISRTKYVHMDSSDMIADIFTKDLPDESYKRHADSILGCSVKSMD